MKHSRSDNSAEELDKSKTISALPRIDYGIAFFNIVQDALNQIRHSLDRNVAGF